MGIRIVETPFTTELAVAAQIRRDREKEQVELEQRYPRPKVLPSPRSKHEIAESEQDLEPESNPYEAYLAENQLKEESL
jgi:hypothetical protein